MSGHWSARIGGRARPAGASYGNVKRANAFYDNQVLDSPDAADARVHRAA